MKKKFSFDIWSGSSLIILLTYLLFLVYPVGNVLKQALLTDNGLGLDNFVTFFSKRYYSMTLFNSFKVSVTATVFSLILGVSLAYCFAMYQFKGKKLLRILIIIASMSAPFIGAYEMV